MEQDLIQALVRKDQRAWYDLHTEYATAMRSWVSKYATPSIKRGAPASIEDFTQEAWALIWERLPNFKVDPERGTFATWLRKTAEWAAHMYAVYMDKGDIKDVTLYPYDDFEDAPHAPGDELLAATKATPEGFLIAAELSDSVDRILLTLPALDREIYTRIRLGETYEELESDLGIPNHRLRLRVHRVKMRIKEVIE